MKSPIIVALDYTSTNDALLLADQLDPTLCRVKVGKELFTREAFSCQGITNARF